MVKLTQVKDLETARQVIRLLEAENEKLHQRLQELVTENARLKGQDSSAQLQQELTHLQEQLALLKQSLFGASSEKRPKPAPQPPASEVSPSGPPPAEQRPAPAQPSVGHGPRAQP